VDLFKAAATEDKRLELRLSVGQSLRDLLAKYTVSELETLIRSDQAAASMPQTTIQRLGETSLGTLAELLTLQVAAPGLALSQPSSRL
jgi:hypothetical protein